MLNTNAFKTQMRWAEQQMALTLPPAGNQLTSDEREQRRKEFRALLEDISKKMVDDFRTENLKTHRSLRVINLIIIYFGIALLAISAISGIMRGVDAFTAITSGIAVADFVAVFLVNPQSKITGLLKDFAQFELIFATWKIHLEIAFDSLIRSDFSDAQVDRFQNAFAKYTEDAIKTIETNIGKE